MSPSEIEDLIFTCVASLVVLVPVLGLTARFALRPLVDAIVRIREAGQSTDSVLMMERRMNLLEQEMQGMAQLRDDLSRLVEAQEFQMRLATPPTPERLPDAR